MPLQEGRVIVERLLPAPLERWLPMHLQLRQSSQPYSFTQVIFVQKVAAREQLACVRSCLQYVLACGTCRVFDNDGTPHERHLNRV